MDLSGTAKSPVLIGQKGPLNGQRWMITKSITIGRDESCDVVIIDRQVSRIHARLNIVPEGVILEDLGSKNGTFNNGEMVTEPVRLQDGDLLQIALVQYFAFLSSDATLPLGSITPQPVASATRLVLDTKARRVWVLGKELLPPLSVPQFQLLQTLYDQQGNTVSRNDLINATWGAMESQGVSEQAFDALVRRLRDRLSSIDPKHNYLITVRGFGLRLENPPEKTIENVSTG